MAKKATAATPSPAENQKTTAKAAALQAALTAANKQATLPVQPAPRQQTTATAAAATTATGDTGRATDPATGAVAHYPNPTFGAGAGAAANANTTPSTQQPTTTPQTFTAAPATSAEQPAAVTPAVDYSALMAQAVKDGDLIAAAKYEQQRNEKIAAQGLSYTPTNNYTAYLPGGAKYNEGVIANGERQGLSPYLTAMFDQQAQQAKNAINYETQSAADQLNRALQDAQPQYEQAIANQLLETKQAQDAKALYNQVNGDRGGLGSAQVSSIGNTGAKNREAIAAQQRQLATDTARQIADLRARGKYEEANQLLQIGQNRLAALYDEQVRLEQERAQVDSTLASLGSNYLQAGLMPSDDMLAAMHIDKATAQKYIDLMRASGSGGSTTGGGKIPTMEELMDLRSIYNEAGGGVKGMDAIGDRLAIYERNNYDSAWIYGWITGYDGNGSATSETQYKQQYNADGTVNHTPSPDPNSTARTGRNTNETPTGGYTG